MHYLDTSIFPYRPFSPHSRQAFQAQPASYYQFPQSYRAFPYGAQRPSAVPRAHGNAYPVSTMPADNPALPTCTTRHCHRDLYDLFRHTPLRWLGYLNDVGQALKTYIPGMYMPLMYGSYGYMLFESMLKVANTRKKAHEKGMPPSSVNAMAVRNGVDELTFQLLASELFPPLVVQSVKSGFLSAIRGGSLKMGFTEVVSEVFPLSFMFKESESSALQLRPPVQSGLNLVAKVIPGGKPAALGRALMNARYRGLLSHSSGVKSVAGRLEKWLLAQRNLKGILMAAQHRSPHPIRHALEIPAMLMGFAIIPLLPTLIDKPLERWMSRRFEPLLDRWIDSHFNRSVSSRLRRTVGL